MEPAELGKNPCANCGQELAYEVNFCRNCGLAVNHDQIKSATAHKTHLQSVALFFGVELIICVASMLIESSSLATTIVFDVIMATVAVVFFVSNWNESRFLLRWQNFSVKSLITLVLLTIVTAVAVNYLTTNLNRLLFEKEYSYLQIYSGHEYGNIIMIISVAVFPALFEELAYRGYLMQKLLQIVDPKEAVYITSILFFFAHFSMISVFWMLPFALLLGYVRLRKQTLWYGVAMHFFLNLTTCLIEIYQYGGGN